LKQLAKPISHNLFSLEPEPKFNTHQPAQRTLDKPKQANATIAFSRVGWACFAILSITLASIKKAFVCCLSWAADFLHFFLFRA
jgi:hypothetical protein